MDVLASPTSDAVSDALRLLNVRSTVFCLSELGSPWAFRVEGTDVAKFHLVLAGSAWLGVDGKDPLALRAGDLVVLPRGVEHTIGDQSGAEVVALERLLRDYPVDGRSRLRYGGTGRVTRLLCGGFVLADHLPESTLELLPDVLRMESTSVGATAWLEPVLATLDSEAAHGEPGTSAILAKIADVFLAQAIRGWLVGADQAGLLVVALLQDRPIANAVQTIRSRFSERWTLELLAAHVGLSRTALATRFRALMGDSPMRYLTKLRLSQAAGHLATGPLSIYEIARLTGYDNDASLSRAFRREFGVPPGVYRETARRSPAISIA
jgi:AraC-like DNA-binding protein/mannose-6-phosphate isomerase-like protein (cupin superfamily)